MAADRNDSLNTDLDAAVEIAMYPLADDYTPAIDAFIAGLNRHVGLTVDTGAMSTRVYGPWDQVMAAISAEMKQAFSGGTQAAFNLRVLGMDPRPLVRAAGYIN